MVERSTPQSFAAQVTALLERPDALAVLPTIRVPTLLLSGAEDNWSPLAQHAEMHRLIPGSTLVAIPDAGHMAPVEQPRRSLRRSRSGSRPEARYQLACSPVRIRQLAEHFAQRKAPARADLVEILVVEIDADVRVQLELVAADDREVERRPHR
jgi:pimeloyl-ACP methyl ester carboxylesterase